MQAVNKHGKVAILWQPEMLAVGQCFIGSLHVRKSVKGLLFVAVALDNNELELNYQHLPKQVRSVLLGFTETALQEVRQKIEKKFAKQRAGVSPGVFATNALLRYCQEQFEQLKPFCGLVKFYHKTKPDGEKNYRIAPCTFSGVRPQLKFAVHKHGDRLVLDTLICLNGTPFSLADFNRKKFLLESRNEYFLLSFKDYQTLEWLHEHNTGQYANSAVAFAQHLLARLEADYEVDRNNHFELKEIVTPPVNRVLLSELNNAFLMFTPQWLYDGFVVENPWAPAYETAVEGQAIKVLRDKDAEDNFVKLLRGLHPNFERQHNGYFYVSFADATKKLWFLKAYHHLLEQGIEIAGIDMLNHFRYSRHAVETNIVSQVEGVSRVTLQLEVKFGEEKIDLLELQKLLHAGQKAVLLKDGSLGVLGDDWLRQYGTIIKHGKVSRKEVEVSKFIGIGLQQETLQLNRNVRETWWQKWKQWQNSDDILFEKPALVKATLRPYQQKGFEWLTLLSEAGAGACLADDMGLGKTLQTICFLARHISLEPGAVNIIVCPASLMYNWQQEIQKFAPDIEAMVYHGATRRREDLDNERLNVVITSYGTLRSDMDFFGGRSFNIAVIDESHNIKNPSAQITTAVNALPANIKVALSGTPVVNNTFDLYAQLNFALPGLFGSREFFKREYADPIDRYRDEEKIRSLQKLTAPFILRRTKEQVAKDLPDKTETILWCKMDQFQQQLYNEVKDQIRGNIFIDIKNNGLGKSKMAVLTGMLKLRQICNSPLLLPASERENAGRSVKTEMLFEELTNILKSHKALVFSQFTSMLDLLVDECKLRGISYFHFDGQTPPAQRAEMVQAFQQEDCTINLFLISLKAGNSGITLTAADYVFLFDPWWNTAVEQQAIDRTHRIGQTKSVFAYKMICKDTIEEKIVQLQQRKKRLAEDLVSDDGGFVQSLSEEDIDFLFS